MHSIVAVLLAAGGSSRMGRPKQLLLHEGKTLLEGTMEKLLEAGVERVFVVLGAHSELLEPLCKGVQVEVVHNLDWQSGMAGSIRAGVEAVERKMAGASHVLIALVDQPHLTTADYHTLIQESRHSPPSIVAAFYGGKAGAPVVFPSVFFKDLMALSGDGGASHLLRGMGDIVVSIPMPESANDWDYELDIK